MLCVFLVFTVNLLTQIHKLPSLWCPICSNRNIGLFCPAFLPRNWWEVVGLNERDCNVCCPSACWGFVVCIATVSILDSQCIQPYANGWGTLISPICTVLCQVSGCCCCCSWWTAYFFKNVRVYGHSQSFVLRIQILYLYTIINIIISLFIFQHSIIQ